MATELPETGRERGAEAAHRVATKLGIADHHHIQTLHDAYLVAYEFTAPLMVRIADDMLADLRADVGSCRTGRVVALGRDGHSLAIAMARLNRQFSRRHVSNLVLSRALVENALQDLENHQGLEFPEVQGYRRVAPRVDPADTIGGFRVLSDFLQAHHVPVGRPQSRVTVFDTSFKGTVQELLAAVYPETTFTGRYAFFGESPHDPHPGSKKGYEVHLAASESRQGRPFYVLPADESKTFAHQLAINSVEELLDGPMTGPVRIGADGPAQTGQRNEPGLLAGLSQGLVSPRLRQLRVREGVKVVNLLAVADCAQDAASLRDSGGDYRARLEVGAQRYRAEIRAWIGGGETNPRLKEFLDSFVHRSDKQHAELLQRTLEKARVPASDSAPILAAYDRCGSDDDKWVFVQNASTQHNRPEVRMGGSKDERDPVVDWLALAELGESYEEFGEVSDSLASGGPPPEIGPSPIAHAPMIIDTDIGGDPDDTVALVAAARRVPELALVVTSDEFGGERARFVRYLLDLAGRQDVRVVAGSDLGNSRLYFVDGLFPADVPKQVGDLVSAVAEVCAMTNGRVRWVGIGPLSNLAMLHERRPELVAKLVVTQMGGAIKYRDPARAEHNFRVDPEAALRMLPALEPWRPTLVVNDVTFNPAIEITADSPIYQRWADPDAPPWAKILRTHSDRWMERYPGSMQHDGLTLAAAMLWPGIRFARERVVLDPIARMSRSDQGTEIIMSVSADYGAFMSWLDSALSPPSGTRP